MLIIYFLHSEPTTSKLVKEQKDCKVVMGTESQVLARSELREVSKKHVFPPKSLSSLRVPLKACVEERDSSLHADPSKSACVSRLLPKERQCIMLQEGAESRFIHVFFLDCSYIFVVPHCCYLLCSDSSIARNEVLCPSALCVGLWE